jgi:NitT/TauT family transport system ATP-binding protein
MDEPFAALDALTREELQDDFLHLVHAHNTSVLFVTHDIPEAVYLGDNVAVMEGGKIVSETPISLNRPRRPDLKYNDQFNILCRNIRGAMAARHTRHRGAA